jgi:ribosomal protein S21
MATNVDVKRKKKDSNMNLIRSFSRKMKQSGVLRKKRSKRFFERASSDYRKKMDALMKITKTKNYEKDLKMGVIKQGRR